MNYFTNLKFRLYNQQIWNVSRALIDPAGMLFQLAVEQAKLKSQFTMRSSQSGKLRDAETKYQRQLMGSLAEMYAEQYLNELLSENQLDDRYLVHRYDDVRTDGFRTASNEYDLKILNRVTQKSYLVESRSSIAYNRSILKAIEQFDIIGPYSSVAKGEEKYNDFYVRPLYAVEPSEQSSYLSNHFENLIKRGLIHLYISGGCLKKQMIEKGYQKSMGQSNTRYRVVKLLQGFDATEFKKEMKEKIVSGL